jgi:putative membrane protein
MKRTAFAAALVLSATPLTIASAPAFAADAPSTAKFVEKVAASDMFEIEAGKVAASQAENSDVKAFGQRMVDDHTKTSDQLRTLVKDNDIKAELPTAIDDKHQAKLKALKDLSGAAFDNSYVAGQVKAHTNAVELFEAYASAGDNADVKQWAQGTLPTLKDHLQQAETLDKKVSKAPAMAANDTMTSDKHADAMDKTAADDTDVDDTATNKDAKAKAVPPSNIKYVTRQATTDWSAQALIGRTVKNPQGEILGDINNVVLNEKGDVVAVTIGVGGFLGLGEKDVGVPFDALDFRTAEVMADKDAMTKETKETKEDRAEEAREARNDTEHDNIEIVLKATREQLENAPTFVWLDQQPSGKKSERSVE